MRYKFTSRSTKCRQMEHSGQNQHCPKKTSKLPGTDSESLKSSQELGGSVSTSRKRHEMDVFTENDGGDAIAVESLPQTRKRSLPNKRHPQSKRDAVHVEKRRRLSSKISDSPEVSDHHAGGQTGSPNESEENAPITDQQLDPVFEHNVSDHAKAERTATQATEETDEALLQAHCISSWSSGLTGQCQSDQNLQDTGCPDGTLAELEKLKSDNAALHSIVAHLRRKILELSIERDNLRDQITITSKRAAHLKNQSTQNDDVEQGEQRIPDLERQLCEATSKSKQELQALERQLKEREEESEQRIYALTMQLNEERNEPKRQSHGSQMQLLEETKESDQRIHDLQIQLSERTNLSEKLRIDHERAFASHQQEKELNQGLIRKLKEKLVTCRKQQQELQASCNEMKNQLLSLEKIKQKNQSIREENRVLAWKAYESQRQFEKSCEDVNQFAKKSDNIRTILGKFILEVEDKGTKPLIQRVRILRKEVFDASELSSSLTSESDILRNKLEDLQQEKQTIFQIIGELGPGIVTRYDDQLCLDMNFLEDEIANIHQNISTLTNQRLQDAQRLKAADEEITRLRHEVQDLHDLKTNPGGKHRAFKEEISTLRRSLAFFMRQHNAHEEPLGGFGILSTEDQRWWIRSGH